MTPIPETKRAVLWSDGANTFTWHEYVETREVGEAYEYIFSCTVTGKQRRWGLVRQDEVN